jgi:hypothetical protein
MTRTIAFSVITMFAVVALAQAPRPAISDTGSGGIPSEPGMYVQTASGFNKILGQIVAFKRSGSLLVSGLTAGIKTRKENVQLLGPHAQTVVDGQPVFYFIPPKGEAEAGVNAGDLILIHLEEKAKRRQFEIGAQGAWRSSSGISITHQIQLFRSEAKPGVYTLTPATEVGKGEYALYLIRGEGTQAYVYDFSVSSRCCGLSRHPDKSETLSVVQSSAAAGTATATKTDNASSGLGTAITNGSNIPRSAEAPAEISSDPVGADIEIDGSFVGSTPSSVGIVAGEHTLRISKNGYKSWERTLKSSTGNVKIAAVLEPLSPAGPALSGVIASTSTIRGSEAAPNPTTGLPEDLIGVWFTGNPTVRHDGVEVAGVQPKGPADNIEIKPGDVIVAIDGHFLVTIEELRAELLRHAVGKPLAIRYRHGRLTSENYLILGSKDTIPQR